MDPGSRVVERENQPGGGQGPGGGAGGQRPGGPVPPAPSLPCQVVVFFF